MIGGFITRDADATLLPNGISARVRIVHKQGIDLQRLTIEPEFRNPVEQLLHRGDEDLIAVQEFIRQLGICCAGRYAKLFGLLAGLLN